jgi:hypothetical protein
LVSLGDAIGGEHYGGGNRVLKADNRCCSLGGFHPIHGFNKYEHSVIAAN